MGWILVRGIGRVVAWLMAAVVVLAGGLFAQARPGSTGAAAASATGVAGLGAVDPLPLSWRGNTLGPQPTEWKPAAVVWPKPGRATVRVPERLTELVPIAGSAVSVGRPVGEVASGEVPGAVLVDVVAPDLVAKATGGVGVGFRIAPGQGAAAGVVQVRVDAKGFTSAFGGDFLSRLRLARVAPCALASPMPQGCDVSLSPVAGSSVDAVNGIVSATVEVPPVRGATHGAAPEGEEFEAAYVLASSAEGYQATRLASTGSWQVGVGSGAFEYGVDIPTAGTTIGSAPSVRLQYSSGVVDGMTTADNTQAGEFGAGWELNGAFIDQIYETTGGGEFSNDESTPDQPPTFRITMNGMSSYLVDRTPSNGVVGPDFALRSDSRWNVKLIGGGTNGISSGRWWSVRTPDGSEFRFGYGEYLTVGAATSPTNSVLSAPVKCGSTWCTQAWRWMLDRAIDVKQMQTAYVYVKDTNKYLRGSTLTAYDRAATLSSIEYGRKSVTTASERPLSRVKFTSTPRCYDTVAALYGFENCPDLASAPQSEYPDVPLDLDCTTGSTCATRRPTFWSHRVVTRAEAQRWVASAGDWIAFDRLELDYKFPTSPTSPLSEATLALAGVKRVGLGAADITLPQTSFGYVLMKQRADADGEATQFEKPRVSEVISELGAKTTVSYGQAGRPCPTVDPPPGGHWANNATLCFPRIWKPDGSPVGPAVWYKYVVEGVNQTNIQPVSGGGTSSVNSGNQRTVYEYVGQPRFAYDDTPYLGPDEQSWSSWRGFAEVRVKTMTDGTYRGTGSSVAMAETQYRIFRGLNGTKGSSGNQSWSLTDFQGGNSMADDPALQGRILESQDLLLNANGNSLYTAGGADAGVRKTLHTYALDLVAGTQGKVRDSYFVRETHTRDKVWIPAKNAYDWVTTARVYDADNRVREESRSGVGLDPRCITRTFGAGTVTGDNRMDYPDVESVNKGCDPDGSGSETAGPLLARSEFTYDAAMNVTKTQRWVNSTGSSKITTSAGYDTYNRVNSTTDGEGNQTTIARSGPTVAPVWEKTTNAKGHVSTVESDYSLLVPTRIEDANGQETVLTYDTLGRLTKARRPGDTAGSEGLAFAYEVHTSEPSAIHTNTRKPNGTYDRSTQFLDAFGQVRQQQSTAPTSSPAANQTLVVNTRYDELGRVAAESDPIEVTGTAGNTFDNLGPTTFNETRTSYDSIDRATNSAYYGKNVAQWDTTTTYTGYTTIVDPPSGAVPVTTVTDVAGRILTRSEKARDNSLTATTTYGYDALDRITSVKDPGNHTTTHKFDLAGRRTATDDPDAGQTTTTYSNTDLPVQVSRESGAMTTTTYDALNRPLTVSGKVAGGTSQPIASYAYDTGGNGIGRLRAVTTKDGGANYVETITGYTPRGKPVGTTWTFPALAGKTTTTSVTIRTTWDVMDRPKTLEYDAVAGLPAESVTNTYSDAASGLPETMTGAVPYVSGTVFAGDGKLTSRTLANTGAPIVRSYAYNDLTSRLASVTTKRGAVAVQDDDFTWNDAGNLLNIRDTTGAGTTRQCFARDQLARLTQAWTTTDATGCMVGDTDAAGPAGYNTRWQYSLDGNITQIARGSTTTPFSYAGGQPHALTNGLGTYTYNSDGQMVIDNGTAITWDPFGYLDRVGPATGGTHFVHAPDGTRLSRVTPSGTATLYVDGQEIDIKSGAIQSARRFYDHAGIAVAIRQTAPSGSGSTLTWQVNDRQGTADLQIPNGAATPVTRLYTDPYGRPRGTATPTTDRWWLGKPTDPTTGYTHLGARYYDPNTNRFLTPDPLIDQTTTQAANPYGYGAANPTLYTDPSGLAAEGASSGSIINPHTGDSTCVIQRCGGTSGGSASGPSGPTGSSRVLDLIESRPIYSRTASRSGTRGRLAVLTIAYPSFSLAAATYLPMAQSWNLSGGGGAGWALQTLRSTGAADGSPPGVLLGKKVINDTLGAGNPLTTRGLAAKSADAAKTGGDILRPLSRVEASTLDDALRPAKLDHVFVPKHNFDPLVTKYGTRSEAMEQIVRSLSGPDLPSIGRFEVNRVVGGQDVVIRGAVIDGVPRIGTAFAP